MESPMEDEIRSRRLMIFRCNMRLAAGIYTNTPQPCCLVRTQAEFSSEIQNTHQMRKRYEDTNAVGKTQW